MRPLKLVLGKGGKGDAVPPHLKFLISGNKIKYEYFTFRRDLSFNSYKSEGREHSMVSPLQAYNGNESHICLKFHRTPRTSTPRCDLAATGDGAMSLLHKVNIL